MRTLLSWAALRRFLAAIAAFATFAVAARTALLANGSFALGAASDLINSHRVPDGLRSYGFAASVGGVAFGATAVPARSDLVLVGLRYDAAASDGQRLVASVETGGVTRDVTVSAPDWQLVPIARYVGDGQHAAMTLFGSMQNPKEEAELRSNGYSIINLQRSLKNTLLGLRLLHADVLILAEASADLPYVAPRTHLLGAGEDAPNMAANTEALRALRTTLQPFGTQPFQSYVITDDPAGVTFDVTAGALTLSGTPYWYAWQEKAMSEVERDQLIADANATANEQLNAEMDADFAALPRAVFDAKYSDAYIQRRFEELFDDFVSPRLLEALPAVSNAITTTLEQLGGGNPEVYRALTQTLRLSALFRRAQATSGADYSAFVATLRGVAIAPCVTTPAAYVEGAPLLLPDAAYSSDPSACAPGDAGGGPGGAGNAGAGGTVGGGAASEAGADNAGEPDVGGDGTGAGAGSGGVGEGATSGAPSMGGTSGGATGGTVIKPMMPFSPASNEGCGCSVPGTANTPVGAWLVGLGSLLMLGRRRRWMQLSAR